MLTVKALTVARMTLSARVIKARKDAGLTQEQLGNLAKVTRVAVTAWESGDSKSISSKHLHRVAQVLGVNAEWLATGVGSIKPSEIPGQIRQISKIPVISWVQAGEWEDIVDNFQPGDAARWLAAPEKAGPRSFFLEVEGDSMYNPSGRYSYRPGEFICVDPDVDAQNHDRVVVRLERKKKTTFKQLIVEGGRSYLKALNPDWPEKIIEVTEDATICGVVIGRWVDEDR